MPTTVALFLSAMPGLAIMTLVICAPMKSATAKAVASRPVTKTTEKATGVKDKTSPKESSTDMSDVDEQSANTASKSDLQATIAKLKYHANPDTRKRVLQMISEMQRTCLHITKKNRLPVPAPILWKSSRGTVSKACQKC